MTASTDPVNVSAVPVRSPEQKEQALAVYAEHGLAEAHRQTGIPKATLHDWARKAGFDVVALAGVHAESTIAATSARQLRCEAMRIELREQMLETAGSLLARVDHPHIDFKGKDVTEVEYPVAPASACRDYVWSAAVLIDKYRLEVGESTDRVEVAGRDEHDEQRLAKIIELVQTHRAS